MKRMDYILGYRHPHWIITGNGIDIRHTELKTAETLLAEEIRKKFPDQKIEVYLRFDMKTIPQWFHQYQNHYFNTILYI